ncbi:mevalonate kinase [Candidatus Woesearchaeota archaeon]|nr:mevalonate kinase [Candidatus Woesearchaeota archaeon]
MTKKNAEASACAKLILLGEHSAVYGHPAIAVPLPSLRLNVRLKDADSYQVKAPVGPEDAEKIIQSLKVAGQLLDSVRKLEIGISSGFPMKAGLGSSAALNVAIARGLAEMEGIQPATGRIAEIAYEMEKIFHGTPSGIDTTVSAWEKPIYFIKGKPPEFIKPKKPLTIVVAFTGISSSTREVVAEVRAARDAEPEKYDGIFRDIEKVSEQGRKCMETGNLDKLGMLMGQDHQLLRKIKVSSPEIEMLVEAAVKSGALGAKLTGAGRGGCVIALSAPEDARRISDALRMHSGDVFVAKIQ